MAYGRSKMLLNGDLLTTGTVPLRTVVRNPGVRNPMVRNPGNAHEELEVLRSTNARLPCASS